MTEENKGGLSCTTGCWLIALAIGVLVAAIARAIAGTSLLWALILGLIALVVAGFLLTRLFCKDDDIGIGDAASSTTKSAGAAGAAVATAGVATAAGQMSGGKKAAGAAPDVAGDTVDAVGDTAKAAGKTVKKTASKTTTAAKSTASKAVSSTKTAAKATTAKAKTAAKSTASKAASTTKAAAKPARKPVAKDGKPEMLKEARAGGADDLKKISGVGPKLEGVLNDLGVYHFDQVAGWSKKDIQWVDDRLKFKGRIERDEWIKQAKALMKKK